MGRSPKSNCRRAATIAKDIGIRVATRYVATASIVRRPVAFLRFPSVMLVVAVSTKFRHVLRHNHVPPVVTLGTPQASIPIFSFGG